MTQFTADMARKMAEEATSLDGPYGREATEKMLDHIRVCAQKGASSCQMNVMPSEFVEIVARRLEAVGFKVTYRSSMRDPDDSYTEVSW